MATSTAEPRYRQLTITFNPRLIADNKPDLEELVVHELAHALTWRLWQFADEILDNYTTNSDFEPWRWMLEEIHEEAVTSVGWALVKADRSLEVEG
jgi:predicted SprT family Zn-dependent metalloprotease